MPPKSPGTVPPWPPDSPGSGRPLLATIPEAMRELRVKSRRTIYKLIREGCRKGHFARHERSAHHLALD